MLYKGTDHVEPRAVNSRWIPTDNPASDESSSHESSKEIDFEKLYRECKVNNNKLNKKILDLLL